MAVEKETDGYSICVLPGILSYYHNDCKDGLRIYIRLQLHPIFTIIMIIAIK